MTTKISIHNLGSYPVYINTVPNGMGRRDEEFDYATEGKFIPPGEVKEFYVHANTGLTVTEHGETKERRKPK